jgi:hypothetical protein
MPPAQAQDAVSLRARHAALREQLAHNPFGRPIHLASTENPGDVRGDVYALIEQPYVVVGAALRSVDNWCDVLILHQNVKGCRSSGAVGADTLRLRIGRKYDQPLADAHEIDFLFRVNTAAPDFLRVQLNADEGPFGTHHYRVELEVADLDGQRSFLHLSYAYAYGTPARIAMSAYLATIGRNKVGFSIVGSRADGAPVYIGGMRGIAERNTMRYYLAIDSYLGALSLPARQQLAKRLNDWHAGVERYPRQLHELDRDEYIEMKRREILRQQGPGAEAMASTTSVTGHRFTDPLQPVPRTVQTPR